MDLQHPDITRAERTGYPFSERHQMYGVDGLGNDVHTGDSILRLNDEFYRVDDLFQETIEVLEQQGATYEIAQ
ncbi:hypothetical protein [Oceanobacillus oncorhynchi]|uniref:hypothetical protein n=1 Tax=Oceanobacillus TaxID=182709 RepID=UPI002116E12F|nr:hypothetical protein [Oceanobacillus oncorhynchi]UUI41149.1 hypothetical protein NP440_06165 [Oceanobacillus oncorhynchi]